MSELEDVEIETIQNKTQRKRMKKKKNTEYQWAMCKCQGTNTHVPGLSKEARWERGTRKKYFKKKVADIFQVWYK